LQPYHKYTGLSKIMKTFRTDVFTPRECAPRYQTTEAGWDLRYKRRRPYLEQKNTGHLILSTEGHWMSHH